MGLPLPLAEFIFAEARYAALPERILLLGRQTVLFDDAKMRRLLEKFAPDAGRFTPEFDVTTVHAKNFPDRRFLTDSSFFAALGVSRIDAIDHSDFEGANIILDICRDLPSHLEGQFDFVYNGSVLDNIFAPAIAIQNISRLLRPGGRVLHLETASTFRYSYSALSPSWYMDYYVENAFVDCKVYVGAFEGMQKLEAGPWPVIGYRPPGGERSNAFTPNFGNHIAVSVVLAEKGPESTWDRLPSQGYYRSDLEWTRHCELADRIASSPRSYYIASDGDGQYIPTLEGVWMSCGTWGA